MDGKNNEQFWTENICILFTDLKFLPTKNMSKEEKLNAITRLIIVLTVILYFMKYDHWLTFLIISILIVLFFYYYDNMNKKEESKKEGVEGFTVVPTYVGTDFQQTVVAPTYAEEWQIPPPAYDIYTQVPYTGDQKDEFEVPLKPQSYPYGQYLTRTNLLPSDEYYTHLGCGGARSAREYINSTFLRHDLAERENMTRIYKKRLNRRFRHSCNDTFSPFHSY